VTRACVRCSIGQKHTSAMGLAPLLLEVAPSLVAASSLLPLQNLDPVR